MSVAVLFPGQGSQFVGMGAELFEARPDLLGAPADEILGWSLREVCLVGPEERLTRTEHAQPALFALSYALWATVGERFGEPAGGAGHSLGEFTALAAAGAMDYGTALGVVAQRGLAMAEAADLEPSGMAALIGADLETAERVCAARSEEGGRLQVANINAPGQVVVAGGSDDLIWLEENGSEFGVRRVIPLKVAGAFHSSFMEPAAVRLRDTLAQVTFGEPDYPVWSNTTSRPHRAETISETLVAQVVSPVRFSDSLLDMRQSGIDVFIHIGPGDVTAGMARRTVPDSTVQVVSEPEHAVSVGEALGTMS